MGLELLENASVIGAALFVIINIIGPVSGAHLYPVVSFVDAWFGSCSWFRAFIYLPFQFVGCIAGRIVANLMFGHWWISWSTYDRASVPHFFSEIIALAGLIFLVFALQRNGRRHLSAAAVELYIFAACFATSWATFANPAVTVARSFTNSFTGIAPSSLPVYLAGQVSPRCLRRRRDDAPISATGEGRVVARGLERDLVSAVSRGDPYA